MAAADQLHQMEGQISRLENEIQRRDDIIQSLRTSKVHKDRRLSQRSSKDNIFKDILSDVDSAVSSAPNSLSPQPSPDLWYRHQDAIQVEVEENLLEAAKKQIQELEKALNLTQAGQKQAQQKVSQLEEQLQDLREQADLLEFRCLELEDSAEKRHCMEELTDSDSGCTSPENRLKNSVSPQLRRSDSGYKSPTRSASPTLKSHHRVVIPPAFSEPDMVACTENYKTIMNSLHLQSVESIFENGFTIDEAKDKIEEMVLTANSESDRLCLQQLVQLLWNLQTLRNSLNDDGFSMVKSKKSFESDVNKCDFDQQTKSGKIIATVSPYSQKTLKSNDLSKSASVGDGDFLSCTSINQESKKVLFGLQESGIFEEGDWESKSTQTDCYDCACPEPESDLATEVLRLNQIREQLEKSGAIKNKVSANVCSSPLDLKQQRRKDRKKIELYENRIAFLENKLSIYESSDNIREKKLAQRLQRELDLQTKVKNLEFDLDRLKRKYIVLEEEKCEFEEAENDTRLHCQELEAEFDILSAKLRDIDDQRNCARNEAECYRQLVEEYEYKIMTMQQNEDEMKQKADIVNQVVPVLVSYNIYCLLEELTKLGAGGGGCNSGCTGPCSTGNGGQSGPPFSPVLMLDYEGKDMKQIGKQLACLAGQGSEMMSAMQQNNTSVQNERKDDKGSQYEPNVNLRNQKVQQATNTVQFEEHATNTAQFDEQAAAKLKMRIEELEKRELAYLETLTKGDEMWAEMEASYKHKLKELEENETQLVTAYNKLKTKFEDKEKKIHEMEETEEIWRLERKAFMDDLREVKKLKDNLERKNNRLKTDLAESRHALEEKERQYQSHISLARNREDSVREELAEQKRSSVELESEYNKEVNTLKRDLRRTAEELNQYKDSVRDLTEVVKTLRENLTEVEFMMNNQKNEYEEKSKSMLTEIKSKNDEVRLLRESIDQLERLPSAHEELEDVISRDRNITHLSPKKPESRAAYQARTNFREDLSIIPDADSNQRYAAGPVSQSQNNDCVPNIWDEQVTTLITIKAIKGPGSGGNNARHSQGGNDDPHHPDRRQPSPYRDRRGGNYSKDDNDCYGRRNNHVSFRHDDCDILYENVRTRTSRMTNDSDINLVDFSSSTGSVPFNYRAKYSPESFDFTSRDSYDQGRCRCSIQNPNDSSNTPRSRVVKSGENKRSCSCPRAAQPEEPKPEEPKPEAQGTCTCCQNKGNNGSRPFEGRPIPLLLIPTSGNQKSKNSKGGKASERKSPVEHEEQEKPKNKSEEKPKSKPEEKPKKPEVPSRKPKPAVAFKPAKRDYELRVPPLHLKEDIIEPTDAIERKYILCHQQIDKMEINSLPKNPTCSMNTLSDIEKSEAPTESSVKNMHETPLSSELESLSTSAVDVCHLSPVPSPRKRTNSGIKRYHSLTESVQSYECESLPPIMSHSDSGVSYNSITAKELIASFNNISEGVKPEKCAKSSYKSVIQPKSIGSFVFDRVTKLTNGLSNPKVAGLKRSVSMVADSKPQPATFYADL